MSDKPEFHEELNAYTAPADSGRYQFCSRPEAPPPPQTRKEKPHRSAGPLIAALLILLAMGTAFCIMILHISISVHHDEHGYSISVDRRKSTEPLVRVEAAEPGIADPEAAAPADTARFEWNGETLRMTSPGDGNAMSYGQLYSACAPAVGILKAMDSSGAERSGAAIVMTEDGALITATHLIAGTEDVTVTLGGQSYQAYIVGLDYATDVAVLKIDASGLPTAVFSSGEDAYPGDAVAVIGIPVGDVVNIADGILSAVNPNFNYRGFSLEALQVALPLGECASGSALVNAAGQVIGIVNMDMGALYPDRGNISLAVSMRTAKAVVDELLKNGCVAGRPSSGLTVSELPAAYAAYYQYPGRLYITSVQENSPAAQAGLGRGDLILEANGIQVESSGDLYAVINGLKAGDTLNLRIFRDRIVSEVSFELMDAATLRN